MMILIICFVQVRNKILKKVFCVLKMQKLVGCKEMGEEVLKSVESKVPATV